MLSITPETRVGALLDEYPQLEQVLIDIAPVFAKLRHPMLRKTVAKIATLETAAGIAGLPIRELVLRLRREIGQDALDALQGEASVKDQKATCQTPPPWTTSVEILATINVEALLERGEHPLAKVRSLMRGAAPGQALRIESAFQPLPLIEELLKAGLKTHSQSNEMGQWTTLITR